MGTAQSLREKLENGWFQPVCVDSIDQEAFYCDWNRPRDRIERHLPFERYVLNEILPFSRHINESPFQIAHGSSFGAYRASNIALRHPGIFDRVVAISGRYDPTRQVGGFRDLFAGYYDQDT